MSEDSDQGSNEIAWKAGMTSNARKGKILTDFREEGETTSLSSHTLIVHSVHTVNTEEERI